MPQDVSPHTSYRRVSEFLFISFRSVTGSTGAEEDEALFRGRRDATRVRM